MEDIINFQIKDFGPINECDMDIGKITIVGGPNASGKSSASKLLYCFLKASCNQRQEFGYKSISSRMRSIINRFNGDIRSHRRISTMEFFDLLEYYEKTKEEMSFSEVPNSRFLERDIHDIDNSIKEIQYNGDSFYISMLNNLFRIEFIANQLNGLVSFNEKFDENLMIKLSDFHNLDLDLVGSIDDMYKPKNYLDIYDVFYIDSFSIFDLSRFPPIPARYRVFLDHVGVLREIFMDTEDESREIFDEKRNKNIRFVEKKIEKIIKGKIEFNNRTFTYNSENSEEYVMQQTASGIKQIGVIQLLLASRKLKEDSFLILDEPEVNLHPQWQFKLAEILVLLAKDLNISLYINCHSPMFIEAMEVFTKYYELEDDTYFYLTELDEESDRKGYKFKYKDSEDLYDLYDNLSDPYSMIDGYRLKAMKNLDDS